LGVLSFHGLDKELNARPEGEKFTLSEHVDELEAALGLSIDFQENRLLHNIAKQKKREDLVECYFDKTLEVDKEMCRWCKSNEECSTREDASFSNRISIIWDEEECDGEDIEKIFHLFRTELFQEEEEGGNNEGGTTKNFSSFFFDHRSPFVFSEANEFTREMVCQPLFSTKWNIQPISEDRREKGPIFSPALAYSPPLRRNLTIFEIQILDALNIRKLREVEVSILNPSGEFPSPLEDVSDERVNCRDFVRAVMDSNLPRDSLVKTQIRDAIEDIYGESNIDPNYGKLRLLMNRGAQIIEFVREGWERGAEVDFFHNWNERGYSDDEIHQGIREMSLEFLESLCKSIIDSERQGVDLLATSFVEARTAGVIIQNIYLK